jgi:pyruvate dehydrogenase E1 component beta subunit
MGMTSTQILNQDQEGDSRCITYAWAINAALDEEMERDDRVFIMGQDVGELGGVFGVTRGLFAKYGPVRVRDVSIVENLLVGAGVGAALGGLRPVVEVQFADFLLVAGDEVFNKMAKWRYMHGGLFTVPMVVRAPCGIQGGVGAEHSQSLEALLWHTPGLKIAVPSNAADAKGLLKSAIRDDNPVVFFEHRRLYRQKGVVPSSPEQVVPLGRATVGREGKDLTVIAWSALVPTVLEAADMAREHGADAEVIDLRTLVPFDMETVAASVRKTSKALIVHEAPVTMGAGAEIAARLGVELFDWLDAPVGRLGGVDVPIPQNTDLEPFCFPQRDDIAQAMVSLARR